jgi:hypothetical protein
MKLSFPYNSFGTFYGTIRDYDSEGNDTGTAKNISGFGLFFIVADKWENGNNDQIVFFRKSVGTGISISGPTTGNFLVTFQSSDLKLVPSEYVWNCFANPLGTTFVDGTTELKSIGSGIFEILEGIKYGSL